MRRISIQIGLFAISVLLVVVLMPSSTGAAPGKATATATAEVPPRVAKVAPLKWPLTPATSQQVDEARACKIDELSKERYPERMPIEKLQAAFTPKSTCDCAVLAAT